MAGPSCHNCVYSVCDPERSFRLLWLGEPIVPRCANHPQWLGQLHDVPGVPCRNYRPRPVLPGGDNVRLIPLGDGFYAYVDAADYEWLSRHTWRYENGYAARWEKGKRTLMHRQIMKPPAHMVVDHMDSNRANNCRSNLRVCTPAENLQNQRKRHGSRSRFKGVLFDKQRQKWFAVCQAGGKYHWRGYFDDEIEAARAYDRMAVELCAEFAGVNFPKEWPPERRREVHTQYLRTAESSSARDHTPESRSPHARTAKPSSVRARTAASSVHARRGESSFAHSSSTRTPTPQKANRKKTEDGRRRTDTEGGKEEKAKVRSQKPHAVTRRRRERKHTAKRPPQKRERHRRRRQKKGAAGRASAVGWTPSTILLFRRGTPMKPECAHTKAQRTRRRTLPG